MVNTVPVPQAGDTDDGEWADMRCPCCMREVHPAGIWEPKKSMMHEVLRYLLNDDPKKALSLVRKEDPTLQVWLAVLLGEDLLHYRSPEFSISILQDISQVELRYPFYAHAVRLGDCPLENWNEPGQRDDRQRPEALDVNWHRVLQEKARTLGYECEKTIGHYRVDVANRSQVLELENTHELEREKYDALCSWRFNPIMLQAPAKSLRKTLLLTNAYDREDAGRLSRAKADARMKALLAHVRDSSPNPQRVVVGLLGSMKAHIAGRPFPGHHINQFAVHVPEMQAFGHVSHSPIGYVLRSFRSPWTPLARLVAVSDLLSV